MVNSCYTLKYVFIGVIIANSDYKHFKKLSLYLLITTLRCVINLLFSVCLPSKWSFLQIKTPDSHSDSLNTAKTHLWWTYFPVWGPISSSGQIPGPVCRRCVGAVCWGPPHWKLKLLLGYRQCGEKKINDEPNNGPHWRPVLKTFTDVIFAIKRAAKEEEKKREREKHWKTLMKSGLQLCA